MIKQLMSIILSILLLFGKIAFAIPTEAMNKKQTIKATSKNEKNESYSIADFVFDTVCTAGLGIVTLGTCHFIDKNIPQNQTQAQSQNIKENEPQCSHCESTDKPQKGATHNSSGKPFAEPKRKATKNSRKTPCNNLQPNAGQTRSTEGPPKFPRREVINSLRNNTIACSRSFIPLRAIEWQNNRCWLNASILHFYLNQFYHDPILRFPVREASQLLLSGRLSEQERATLEAMICLSEIFGILRGSEDDPDFQKPQVVSLGNERENDLIDKLAKFNNLFNAQPAEGNTLDTLSRSTAWQNACTTVIDELLKESATYAQNQLDNPALRCWFNSSRVFHMRTDEIPNEAPLMYLEPRGYHFWVEVEREGTTFEIGKLTRRNTSITIKRVATKKPTGRHKAANTK